MTPLLCSGLRFFHKATCLFPAKHLDYHSVEDGLAKSNGHLRLSEELQGRNPAHHNGVRAGTRRDGEFDLRPTIEDSKSGFFVVDC